MLDIDSVSELLGVSTATVRNWNKAGVLKSQKVGRKLYFDASHISEVKINISQGVIDRLGSRANKRAKSTTRTHEELGDRALISRVVGFCRSLKAGGLESKDILRVIGYTLFCGVEQAMVRSMLYTPEDEISFSVYSNFAVDFSFADVKHEVMAIAYQHLQSDGEKAVRGAVYTPAQIAVAQVNSLLNFGDRFLDPCCGSGVYLVSAIRRMKELGVKDWWNFIFGVDVDPLAVVCAEINCYLEMHDSDCGVVKIICCNALLDESSVLSAFGVVDVIASNPPWGAHIEALERFKLEKKYQAISSGESFSYFILLALRLLKGSGVFSYLLPESVCFTSQHRDVRKVILESGLVGVYDYGKLFKGLMTGVVRLDFKLGEQSESVSVCSLSETFNIELQVFRGSMNFEINYKLRPKDFDFISKVEASDCIFLKNSAIWALGIVTGNNAQFLSDQPGEDLEPVYRGKDVAPYVMKEPSTYIKFDRGAFQQCAGEEVFRHKEKLVYKFISGDICVAYDVAGSLTLNSANILIPKVKFDVKYVLACLNSRYASQYFKVKFNSVKVLKGHLEQIPVPNVSRDAEAMVVSCVDEILNGIDVQRNIAIIDDFFDDFFGL